MSTSPHQTLAEMKGAYGDAFNSATDPAPPSTLTPLKSFLSASEDLGSTASREAANKDARTCTLCGVTCTSFGALEAHRAGRVHQMRLGLCHEEVKKPDDKEKPAESATANPPPKGFSCTLCNITLSGPMPYEDHMNGAKHRKAVVRKNATGKVSAIAANRPGAVAPHPLEAPKKEPVAETPLAKSNGTHETGSSQDAVVGSLVRNSSTGVQPAACSGLGMRPQKRNARDAREAFTVGEASPSAAGAVQPARHSVGGAPPQDGATVSVRPCSNSEALRETSASGKRQTSANRKQMHSCSTCNVFCDTPLVLAVHMKSMKHRRKAEYKSAAAAYNDLWCDVCQTRMPGERAYKEHVNGVKHRKRVANMSGRIK